MQAEALLDALPLVAILRHLPPAQAVDVGRTLFTAGIRVMEVPLNSPNPFDSIEQLSRSFGDTCVCGAGTVLGSDDVVRARDAGASLIVAPNFNASVVESALAAGMLVMPGIATATEAFAAIELGALRLKLFPASTYGPGHLKALKEVLPAAARLYPVGGIGAADMTEYVKAGAAGFGFGGELYRPAYSLADIATRARRVVALYRDSLPDPTGAKHRAS
jgi:2-dehydro-3-deoxyphosphogalactonate aldolase